MIILPNKFERYCFCLRNKLQTLILKNGYKTKYLQMLAKIHKAEALFCKDFEPVNLESFCIEIFNSVRLKHYKNYKNFSFTIANVPTVILNKKRFTSLILTLASKAREIEISNFESNILIKAHNVDLKQSKRLLKTLNTTYFFLRKSKTIAILISAQKTDKAPKKEIKDWEYLLNPLSVVNIYLS